MAISSKRRRPSAALLTAGVVLSALLGLAACGADGERPVLPSSAPSVDRPSLPSIDRPSGAGPESSDDAKSPAATVSPTTRPTRTQETTAAPAPGPTRTRTTEATGQPAAPTPTTARTTTATQTTTRPADPTTAASATAATDAAGGLGALGWLLLVLLAAGVVGGVLIWRSKRKTDWTIGATALAADTRDVVGVRLPSVLATVTTAQRALSWPPVRADLVDLASRWALLSESAPGEQRANWSRQVWGLLQELVAAVDAENEALATGQQWQPMRLRVDDIARTLSATLRGDQGAVPEPPLA